MAIFEKSTFDPWSNSKDSPSLSTCSRRAFKTSRMKTVDQLTLTTETFAHFDQKNTHFTRCVNSCGFRRLTLWAACFRPVGMIPLNISEASIRSMLWRSISERLARNRNSYWRVWRTGYDLEWFE
ncbi:hypothetical protein ABW19_dt0207989 [Dactylella cylindrospora]|nr:hypothetical protein ABW19_dt0207989 [Dactylella cylindrospora]